MVYVRVTWVLVVAFVLALGTGPAWAQEKKQENKQVFRGPAEVTFGQMLLSVGPGASSQVEYQPQQNRLTVETLVGEARVITSARNLLLVENLEGKVQVLLTSTGRVVVIEPGKSEIFGRAIVNDPGQIIVTVASKINSWVLGPGEAYPVSGNQPGANLDFRPRPEGCASTVSPTCLP